MKHLGDIRQISGYTVPPVDVVTGGSPCQDLSVAGKRAGLAGERSGLFLEQIRIVKEMREADERRGRTGIYIRPRFLIWENVPGAFSSNKGRDFQRVLSECVRIAEPDAPDIPCPEKWPLADCWYGTGWSIAYRVLDTQFWGVPQRRRRIALVADFGGHAAPEILFVRKGVSGDFTPCGTPGEGASGIVEKSTYPAIKREPEIIVQAAQGFPLGFRPENVRCYDEKATTLCNGTRPGFTCGVIQTGVKCLNPWDVQSKRVFTPESVCGTLNAGTTEGMNIVPCVFDAQRNGDGKTVCTLTGDHANRVTDYTPIVAGYQGFGDYWNTETAKSILASDDVTTSDLICGHDIVRRLTPLECERLQGFPDGWTDIGDWTDANGKTHKTSDSARYKALGNSIALPPWKWVLKRISAQYERDATLGSLFDGIGGFPLIWEQINGRGSALWASEIEEFCIAVTKRHFEEAE